MPHFANAFSEGASDVRRQRHEGEPPVFPLATHGAAHVVPGKVVCEQHEAETVAAFQCALLYFAPVGEIGLVFFLHPIQRRLVDGTMCNCAYVILCAAGRHLYDTGGTCFLPALCQHG